MTALRRGSPEWKRRAEAWGRAHGMPAELWLGPDLDPLPEPEPGTQPPGPEISPPGPFQPRAATRHRIDPPPASTARIPAPATAPPDAR